MTNEEMFQMLLQFATLLGYDVCEMDQGDFPESCKENRGFFRQSKSGPLGMPGQGGEIFLRIGLPLDERVEVLAHEIGHITLSLLGVEPYQPLTHEPVAVLFVHSLLASLRGDFDDPIFKICKSTELFRKFLSLVKEKQDKTFSAELELHKGYIQYLKEKEGKGEG